MYKQNISRIFLQNSPPFHVSLAKYCLTLKTTHCLLPPVHCFGSWRFFRERTRTWWSSSWPFNFPGSSSLTSHHTNYSEKNPQKNNSQNQRRSFTADLRMEKCKLPHNQGVRTHYNAVCARVLGST